MHLNCSSFKGSKVLYNVIHKSLDIVTSSEVVTNLIASHELHNHVEKEWCEVVNHKFQHLN